MTACLIVLESYSRASLSGKEGHDLNSGSECGRAWMAGEIEVCGL